VDVSAALEALKPVGAIASIGRNALRISDWLNAKVDTGNVDTSLEAVLDRLPPDAPPWEIAAALKPLVNQGGACVVMSLAADGEEG
jgi:hypothetical protein